MRVQDLGALRGEITLFGGPYSNRQALEALLERSAGTTRICTGDLVAYCGAPAETVAQVRALQIPVVAGNCEQQLAANALDCGCGFEAGTTCDVLSAGWYAYANARIRRGDRQWMASLPNVITFKHGGKRYAVLHGGARDVARFIWSNDAAHVFEEEVKYIKEICGDVDVVFAGHSGIAFSRDKGDVQWINAGVIGMPPHDGTDQTEYVRVLDSGVITFEKLTYDVAGAACDMTRAGLTQGYHSSLVTGFWPSEDVLPPQLRRQSSRLANG